jgi:hypothetical protein
LGIDQGLGQIGPAVEFVLYGAIVGLPLYFWLNNRSRGVLVSAYDSNNVVFKIRRQEYFQLFLSGKLD